MIRVIELRFCHPIKTRRVESSPSWLKGARVRHPDQNAIKSFGVSLDSCTLSGTISALSQLEKELTHIGK